MTDNNSNPVDIDDLDTFEDAFYEKEAATDEVDEVVEDTEDDALATEEDTDAPEGDDEQETEEDSDEEETPQPQNKGRNRKSAKERINEITRRAYEAERREAALLQRLEALESRTHKDSQDPQVLRENLPQGAPTPDAVDAKGEPLYPLGEFDPLFIRDLSKFTAAQEFAAQREQEAQAIAAQRLEQAKNELKTTWAEKLEQAEEQNPEIREDIGELVDTFQNIDPTYGEYLALTIMQSENGPQILEYLSQNIGEAQNIVASGPAAATYAIGRLDSHFTRPTAEKRNAQTVSHAPEPPETVTRGRKGQKVVRGDTDDLDAFERVYFKK